MKKLLIITAIVLLLATSLIVLITVIGESKLSDETWKDVNDLRWKHYGYTKGDITYLDSTWTCPTDVTFIWNPDWETIMFDDETGILYCETPKGKWFIEMEKIEEEKEE